MCLIETVSERKAFASKMVLPHEGGVTRGLFGCERYVPGQELRWLSSFRGFCSALYRCHFVVQSLVARQAMGERNEYAMHYAVLAGKGPSGSLRLFPAQQAHLRMD
jgi:hypothetical protein